MSSKRKNVPIKLSPTMSKSNSINDGSRQPDNRTIDNHRRGLQIDVSPKRRSSVADCSEDSLSSPPPSKKARILSSLVKEDVLSSVKQAVMGSGTSVTEKQQQLSQMIAELQNLRQDLATDDKVRIRNTVLE